MNWFLFIGAIISLVGMFFHGVAGQTKYMGNIYKSEMEPLSKSLSLVSWHMKNFRNLMVLGSLACAFHHE